MLASNQCYYFGSVFFLCVFYMTVSNMVPVLIINFGYVGLDPASCSVDLFSRHCML